MRTNTVSVIWIDEGVKFFITFQLSRVMVSCTVLPVSHLYCMTRLPWWRSSSAPQHLANQCENDRDPAELPWTALMEGRHLETSWALQLFFFFRGGGGRKYFHSIYIIFCLNVLLNLFSNIKLTMHQIKLFHQQKLAGKTLNRSSKSNTERD